MFKGNNKLKTKKNEDTDTLNNSKIKINKKNYDIQQQK